ncbi:Steroid 5-alpha-reductase DET2 [Capsicum baccatum]|uniref:Steroid 5-alpha-reductase DET2 n=1 Tax=Capsicum baccatum TaxID=33114 RepID=A0A2G2VY72_CAPBA|nr:Steroid 5-alpha-reductase DET2 [Capsicum baccatum]
MVTQRRHLSGRAHCWKSSFADSGDIIGNGQCILVPGHWKTNNGSSDFPLIVALLAFVFNLLNAYVQVRWVSHYADCYSNDWFWFRYASGLAVFVGGMAANVWADRVLLGLKREGGGYKVPRGGLFEYVSCPNYLGEIVEWLGWALMTWSWAGLGFFLYTIANLVPRARFNHEWYLKKFGEDYPRKRKAVIPFLY